jgi:hypothetical protein
MKKLTLLFVALLFSKILFSQEDYQGDLSFRNYSTDTYIDVVVESESIPYEGMNYILNGCNRYNIIMNGVKFIKYYSCYPPTPTIWQMKRLSYSNIPPINGDIAIVHCSANNNSNLDVWGYGRYKITITTPNNTYLTYINTLDNKYQDDDLVLGYPYGRDFVFEFNGDNAPHPLELKGYNWSVQNPHIAYIEPYTGGEIFEVEVWELMIRSPVPAENNFYSGTTPFGFTPGYPARRTASIGTRVIVVGASSYEDLEYGYNTLQSYYNNPDIPSGQNVPGQTIMTPSAEMFDENGTFTGIDFIVEPDCIFETQTASIYPNLSFWISSKDLNTSTNGDILRFKKNSILKTNHFNYPNGTFRFQTYKKGKLIDEGSIKNFLVGTSYRAWPISTIAFTGTDEVHTLNNGTKVEIEGGANLIIGENTTLKFDGTGSNLILHDNANIVLGTNAKIIFSNGAYCQASYANFDGNGEGLIFENASTNSYITHCTFNSYVSPIKIFNSNSLISITNNIFNLQNSTGESGIYFENSKNIIIQNNTFNLSSNANVFASGIYAKFINGVSPDYINITGNTFNNGTISIINACFGGSHISNILISSNTFNGNANINILQRMVDADIRYNNLCPSSPYSNVGFQLTQANPGFLWNNVKSYVNNIYITSASYPHLAPNSNNEDDLVLSGGGNIMQSQINDNIWGTYFYAYLDNGNNNFTKYSSSAYHISGQIDLQNPYEYYMRNNCWNGTNCPTTLIYYYLNGVIHYITPIWQPSSFNCNISYSYDDIILTDRGNGINDTTFIRNSSNLQPGTDEEIYTQACYDRINENYFSAISTYKNLIDNYTSSNYLYSSLYELFDCYNGLDTGSNEQERIVLFSNLANYLDIKIQSNLYNYQFNEIAYNLLLSCDVNMEDYEDALNGYEFISLYHPDLYTRIMASWDFAEVEDLMGQGGSEPEIVTKMTNEEYRDFRMKSLDKMIKPDPILNKMKKLYLSESKKHDENILKIASRNTESSEKKEININEIKNREKVMETNVLSNLRSIKHMTKKEKVKKQFSDLLLTVNDVTTNKTQRNNTVPITYYLSQNYPNPFNPITKIDYNIPRDGKVKLVIYDLLGREIKTLVNEFKTIGKYSVEFNGSNLASGVYFYRIQAGDFSEVKRMILLK